MWKPILMYSNANNADMWHAQSETNTSVHGPFKSKNEAIKTCFLLNAESVYPQTEAPEEKEALDRLSAEDFIVTNEKKIESCFDDTPAQFESLAVEVNSEPVWNGEGLPPVGVDVMTSYTDTGLDGWCDFHGPSQVIAFADEHCWVAHHGKFHRVHKICNIAFKPVEPEETPEQKAAREAEELVQYWVVNEMKPIDVAKQLIEQGYRKPE